MRENSTSLFWFCPTCGRKVNFQRQLSSVFDEDGEADFDPADGLCFHTIYCECGHYWVIDISSHKKGE